MVVNFRTREISRAAVKLTRTSKLIKKFFSRTYIENSNFLILNLNFKIFIYIHLIIIII
jgi:hypothetical protein